MRFSFDLPAKSGGSSKSSQFGSFFNGLPGKTCSIFGDFGRRKMGLTQREWAMKTYKTMAKLKRNSAGSKDLLLLLMSAEIVLERKHPTDLELR